MTRRTFLFAAAAAPRPTPLSRYRLGLCQDLFAKRPFEQVCELARLAGYNGIEMTPAALAPDPTALSALDRRVVRNALVDNGLQLAGLRNLLDGSAAWHATTNDATRRRRTWDYLRRMVDLCADIGDASHVILGSGPQRATVPGMSVADATARLRDGLNELANAASIRGVTVVLEPLPASATNVVNTIDQAAALVRRINSPAIRTMLNMRAAAGETLPAHNLIRVFAPLVRYVRITEADTDLRPILQALQEAGYTGWVSADLVAAPADAMRVASEKVAELRRVENALRQ